jgi:hypothetical protein
MFIKDNKTFKATHTTFRKMSILYAFSVFLITGYKFGYYINLTTINQMFQLGIAA